MCAPYKCSSNCHGRAATNHAIFKIWNASSPQMHLIFLSHFFIPLLWRILRLFWRWGVLKPSFSSQKQKATRQESKQQRFMLCEFNTRKVQTAHSHSKMYRPSRCGMVACEIRCGSSMAGSWVAAKDGLHIFKRRTNGLWAAEKHTLTVRQPQQSRHGPRRTYCDGSRVIPFEMTAHTMGCDDDKARPSCKGCSEQSNCWT